MQVQDAMTRNVELVNPSTCLADAARLLRDLGIGALAVGQDNRLVGMVTDRDLVIRGLAENADPGGVEVRHCMTPQVLYCYADQSVDEVAANMAQNQVRRLPVVDRDKRLVGIVALADIAAATDQAHAGQTLRGISAEVFD